MKVVVVGGGSLSDLDFLKERCMAADFVVAADGGAGYLHSAGLVPDVLIGDFDSVPEDVLDYCRKKGVRVSGYPAEKDYTDMELALDEAVRMGADDISILGATGSRLDHSAANIFLLYSLLQRNVRGCIEDPHNKVFLTDKKAVLKKQENCKVSLLSVSSEVTGITTSGLKYPLDGFNLKLGSARGISNEFTADEAVVDFQKGLLMIILSFEP
jgi:thiamine pyrophosphokinase